MSENYTWNHHNPVRIVCAPLETLNQHISGKNVLLVTTPGFVKRGVVQRVKQILLPKQVKVWDRVEPNPDFRDLDAATQSLCNFGIDCVVGLGGGSALDAAKVLSCTVASPARKSLLHIFRYKAVVDWKERLPLVAIPTTSGTGAEVTPFATIWDHEKHQKHSLAGDFIYPDVALLDGTLTLTLGTEDTLYPALDTISHALESLWNKNCTPVSRAFALQALALSNHALPLVLSEPNNLKLRRDLQTASVLAGLAISQTKTAIAHAISYPVTSYLGVPHGLACSFSLPQLLTWSLPSMVSEGMDHAVLVRSLSLLRDLQLEDRISKLVAPGSIQALQAYMVTKGRSENFKYRESVDIGALVAASLSSSNK